MGHWSTRKNESQFGYFPAIFENNSASKNDIGDSMKTYAGKKRKNVSTSKNANFKFHLTKRYTDQSSAFLFFSIVKWVSLEEKQNRFIEPTLRTWFNSFVQSVVYSCRQKDKSCSSSVVADTRMLLAESYYGSQIMDCGRHTTTKCLSDQKTHVVDISQMFKKLNHGNNEFYDDGLAKTETEHKEPIVITFFILQYAKLRILELY